MLTANLRNPDPRVCAGAWIALWPLLGCLDEYDLKTIEPLAFHCFNDKDESEPVRKMSFAVLTHMWL